MSFLDLDGYFCFYVREVFDYNLLKYFLRHFLFLSFWNPYNLKVSVLNVAPRLLSLRLPSFFFHFFHYSALLQSVILVLVPSSVFFLISAIVLFIADHLFFISSISLLNISCIFSICTYILFNCASILFLKF